MIKLRRSSELRYVMIPAPVIHFAKSRNVECMHSIVNQNMLHLYPLHSMTNLFVELHLTLTSK